MQTVLLYINHFIHKFLNINVNIKNTLWENEYNNKIDLLFENKWR
jgi:hypothetical protein